jgi:multiple sugar transport system substrate-binding protein
MATMRRLSRRELLVGGGALLATAGVSVVTPKITRAAPAVGKKVKLEWIEWMTPEISEPKMQGILNAFYQTDPGRNIEVVRQSLPFGQVYDKILTLHMAGQVPDVLMMHPPWAPVLADQGVLEPLSPYLDRAGKEWTANLVQATTPPWKGSVYSVPLTVSAILLYYNERKLAEAGVGAPPKTWADLEAIGPKLTNPARNTYCYVSGMAAKSPYDGPEKELLPLIYQSDDLVLKNGKCNLNSPAAVRALKAWLKWVNDLKLYAPGALTNMGKDKNEAFIAGQAALVNNHPTLIATYVQRDPQLKFGVAPLLEDRTYGTVAGGWNACIGKASGNKEAAWEFLHWLAGPEGSAKVTLAGKQLPGNRKADVNELFQVEPRMKIAAEVFARGRCYTEAASVPEAVNLFRILVEQIHEAANRRKTPEQALETATAEWNKIIAKYA